MHGSALSKTETEQGRGRGLISDTEVIGKGGDKPSISISGPGDTNPWAGAGASRVPGFSPARIRYPSAGAQPSGSQRPLVS